MDPYKYRLVVHVERRNLMTDEINPMKKIEPMVLVEFGSATDAVEFCEQLKITLNAARDKISPIPVKTTKG